MYIFGLLGSWLAGCTLKVWKKSHVHDAATLIDTFANQGCTLDIYVRKKKGISTPQNKNKKWKGETDSVVYGGEHFIVEVRPGISVPDRNGLVEVHRGKHLSSVCDVREQHSCPCAERGWG
jgi:hypothetical protein